MKIALEIEQGSTHNFGCTKVASQNCRKGGAVMNVESSAHEGSEEEVRSGIARHILQPLANTPVRHDTYGELKYEVDGDTVFFTFNAQGLTGGAYYGLYSGIDFLGLGYAVQSGTLNIQGYRPNEIMEGDDFKLFSMNMGTIRPNELILCSES